MKNYEGTSSSAAERDGMDWSILETSGDFDWKESNQEKNERAPSVLRKLGRKVLGVLNFWHSQKAETRVLNENERVQEVLEGELNARLTRVEEIRRQAEAGNPEVERRMGGGDNTGQEVEIFDLKGYPFAMLSHDLEYQGRTEKEFGAKNAVDLIVERPALWMRAKADVLNENKGAERGLSAVTLSTSYINSGSNIETRMGTAEDGEHPELCYGFDHVEPNSLLDLAEADVGLLSDQEETLVNERRMNFFEDAEGNNRTGGYNEVAIKRYGRDGMARRPDYIIAENGQITDEMMNHAAFFGVPIMNIERAFYDRKFAEKVKTVLQEVNVGSKFEEIEKAIGTIGSLAGYVGLMKPMMMYGDGKEGDWWQRREKKVMDEAILLEEAEKRALLDLLWAEKERRIEFIGQQLEVETEKCQGETDQGEKYELQSGVLRELTVSAESGKTRKKIAKDGEWKWEDIWMVEVDMVMKDGGRRVRTRVYRDEGEEGEAFRELAPKVVGYLQAQWQNEERAADM